MPRSREHAFAQPELGQALAWLRARRYLTQKEVVALAREQEELSDIYYQLIENGKRRPAVAKLDAILAALDSDRQELEGLITARVWEGAPRGAYRIRSARPNPAAYRRAAEAALHDSAGPWSDEVGRGTTPSLPDPFTLPDDEWLKFAQPPQASLTVDLKRRSASISSPPDRGNEPFDPLLSGQLAELADHFSALSPKRREQLLERARKLRHGRSS